MNQVLTLDNAFSNAPERAHRRLCSYYIIQVRKIAGNYQHDTIRLLFHWGYAWQNSLRHNKTDWKASITLEQVKLMIRIGIIRIYYNSVCKYQLASESCAHTRAHCFGRRCLITLKYVPSVARIDDCEVEKRGHRNSFFPFGTSPLYVHISIINTIHSINYFGRHAICQCRNTQSKKLPSHIHFYLLLVLFITAPHHY